MTTVQAAAARRVSYQLDTRWGYEPTHQRIESLYVTEVLIPRLERLGLLSARVAPRYREIGLLD